MKIKPVDIVVIAFSICTIFGLSLFIIYLLSSFTIIIFHDYHVVVDTGLLILFFILFSSIFIQVMLRQFHFKAESFDMLSRRATYWKLITSVTEIGGMYFLPFVPLFLRSVFFKLFGARIGKNVEIAGKLIELPLITIDDYAFIGGNVQITAHAIVHDRILLSPVNIAKKATVGIGAIIMPGVEIGENSVVTAGAVVVMDTKIPANEMWGGIPAKNIKNLAPSDA